MSHEFAVVLGLSPTGLYAIRELGEEGIPVLGVTAEAQAGFYSRFLTLGSLCISNSESDRLVDELIEQAKRVGKKGVLIPTSDVYIEFIVKNRAALEDSYHIPGAYQPTVYASMVDKGPFYKLCEQYGVAFPSCVEVERADLKNANSDIRYPFILKPTLIHHVKDFMAGRKVLVVDDEKCFRETLEIIPEADTRWLVQEIVPGPDSEITLFGAYFDKEGNAHQSFTCTKVRQYPPGFGSASLVRSAAHEETRQISESFLKALGYHGIAGTEFKWDERDEVFKIIEINPRPTLWFSISHHSNKRIAFAAFCDLTGAELPGELEQRNDVMWCYCIKDIWSKLFYLFKGRKFVLPAPDVLRHREGTKKTVFPVAYSGDMKPVYGELKNYLRKFLRRK